MRLNIIAALAMPLIATANDSHVANLVAEAFVHMDAIDANGDGEISRAEFDDYVSDTAEDYFRAGDTDGDGSLSRSEFGSWDVFAAFDMH